MERVGELSNEAKTFLRENFEHRPDGACRNKWVQVTLLHESLVGLTLTEVQTPTTVSTKDSKE